MMKAQTRIICAVGGMFFTSLLFADAPIVDESWNANAPQTQQQPQQQSSSPLAQMEQPVASQQMVQQSSSTDASQDLLSKIDEMQQEIRDLNGQIELQNHRIQQLQTTQQQIYADLNSRLDKLGGAGNSSSSAASTVTAPIDSSANTVPANPTTSVPQDAAQQNAPQSVTQAQDDFKETQLYQSAYRFMGVKQYTQAEAGMKLYLQQYPTGKYSANAHYWVAEMELLNGNLGNATQEFATVVTQFKTSDKVADSQLKLGYIYYQEGKFPQARTAFNMVKKDYPNSSTAQLAQQRLDDMDRQGV